jgi:hypothetical protein
MRSFRGLLLPVLLVVIGAGLARAEDKILVPGKSPLTQSLMDGVREYEEWVLDIRLTEAERRRWERLFVDEFKKKDADNSSVAERDALRARYLPATLANLAKSRDRDDKLLLQARELAHKPGGPKNPILVDGEPPLTKVLMDQELLWAEWLLDLPLTEKERRDYQALFIKGWKTASKDKKEPMVKNIQV